MNLKVIDWKVYTFLKLGKIYLEFSTIDVSLFEEDWFSLDIFQSFVLKNMCINIDRSTVETSINGN